MFPPGPTVSRPEPNFGALTLCGANTTPGTNGRTMIGTLAERRGGYTRDRLAARVSTELGLGIVRRQMPRPDPMDTLIVLLDERRQAGRSAYDSISLERAITRQADAVLRRASRAAVETSRRLAAVSASGQGAI